MDALILAAGFGTRLGNALEGDPKPLLKIGEHPLLAKNLDKLLNLGLERIFVNTHFMHNKIQDYIVNSKKYSEKVIILHEEELLGTAGAVKRLIKEYHPDNLLVMHGDNYFQDSLVNLVSEFRNLNSTFSGVLGTFITSQPENCGILTINNGRIEKIYEKSKSDHGNIANSAIYLFNQIILKKISELDSESNDLSTHLIPFIIKELKPIPLEGLFIDIGTPENLDKARLHSKID